MSVRMGSTIASKGDATAAKSAIIVDPLLILRLITKIKCVHMSEQLGMEVQIAVAKAVLREHAWGKLGGRWLL